MNSAAASSILKSGIIIGTKLTPNSTWYSNIIYDSEGNILRIPLTEEYLKNYILVGSTITLKHTGEYYEYLFEGIISNIDTSVHPALLTININTIEELINTRAFPRYDTHLASTVRPAWDEKPHFCIATNICLGGMAFISKSNFDYGEESEVYIYLPENLIAYAKGKVIRKSARHGYMDYSMQFIEMTEDNSNLLSSYIATLDSEMQRLKDSFVNFE